MRRTILAPADLGGAALSELKRWLAITTGAEDGLLTGLLGAATGACEDFTGTMPLQQSCEEVLPVQSRQLNPWQTLRTSPVEAITAVDDLFADGARFARAVESYEIEIDAEGSGMVRLHSVTPSALQAERIAVRFVAGLAPDWEALPDPLRHGIVRLAAHLYGERDGAQAGHLPAAVSALWRPWRQVRLT